MQTILEERRSEKPSFLLIAVITRALGIGAIMAICTMRYRNISHSCC